MFKTCYDPLRACKWAGNNISKDTRECNAYKDRHFVSCSALENPLFIEGKTFREHCNSEHSGEKTAIQLALEKIKL